MTQNEQTTCADCGAVFPLPPASGGASGYAVTRVPRFTAPRERILGCDAGQRGTIRAGDRIPHNEQGAQRFPAVYDVEGHAEAQRIDKLLGGETVSIDERTVATAERRICYACCAILESETMVATGRVCLYLVTRPAADTCGGFDRPHVRQTSSGPYFYRYKLSNWPGSAGFVLIGRVRESHGYGFGRRYPVRTFNFRGPDGFVWSGRSAGDMDLARCKRTRQRFKASVPTA